MTRPAPGTRLGRSRRSVAHDQLHGITLVGRVRTDLFRNDIGAIERHEIVGPRIDAGYTEHLLNTYTLVTRRAPTGHPAGWPSDETPAGAPAGGTR